MKKFKSLIISILCIFIFSTLFVSQIFALDYGMEDIDTYSEGVMLINLDTNTVVYESNADETYIPASLTKIMTFIVASELVEDLEETVIAPLSVFNELVQYNASAAGFVANEEIRIIDLLYGLILPSGCDAASILASTLAEDSDAFIDLMNEKAIEIGATNTHFGDEHGLDNDDSYTSAADMALITQYAMQNELFLEISTTVYYELPATNMQDSRMIYHTNQMLYSGSEYYNSLVEGIKTGTNGNYEKNLVTVAEDDGVNYLLVLLCSPPLDSNGNAIEGTYSDTNTLYNYVFSNLFIHSFIEANTLVETIDIAYAKNTDTIDIYTQEDVNVVLPNTVDTEKVITTITIEEDISAPIEKGSVVGNIQYIYEDEVIASTNLITNTTIEKSYFKFIWSYLKYVVIALAVLLMVFAIVMISLRMINKSRHRSYRTRRRH